MKKKIASIALAAAALGGTAALVPVVASAQDDPPTEESAEAARASFLTEALQPLLDNGTLDQGQFDAVVTTLQDARPEHGRHGGVKSLDTLTGVLGVEEEALREALKSGQSIADIATENGVAVQDVIDALVAAANARLDEAVAEGHIDAATADEKRAELEEKITARVNGEVPEGARGFGPRGFGPPADEADTGT